MDKQKLIHQLFIGKVVEIIGQEKAIELLREAKTAIESIEPQLPLGDVSGSLQCDSPVNALREWINLEITERREYTASKTFEEVLKKVNILFPDKCTCKTRAQAEDCERNCGCTGQ